MTCLYANPPLGEVFVSSVSPWLASPSGDW